MDIRNLLDRSEIPKDLEYIKVDYLKLKQLSRLSSQEKASTNPEHYVDMLEHT